MFGFLEEFYLENQWKSKQVVLFLEKSRKARESAQKGKDLPIETGQDRERCRNSRNNGCYSCRHRCQEGKDLPIETVKSSTESEESDRK